MKTDRPPKPILLEPTIAVPVYRLSPEPTGSGHRVIAQVMVNGETWVIVGLESDRLTTLKMIPEPW
ncbi:hypothetical protein [Deinococcus aerophilus]|uniref:Transposase n=1 Tax=Deinococcus aerophilus TaxID=522488 RepID=A0ABQ2H151_9DEIO|nr:hypothetical protein [Deinococcus aerophilus]GGM22282.1 hypothetical protein GCM10010841_32690 [Deinococcus aerophilus]